jgi:hypothetical protein
VTEVVAEGESERSPVDCGEVREERLNRVRERVKARLERPGREHLFKLSSLADRTVPLD